MRRLLLLLFLLLLASVASAQISRGTLIVASDPAGSCANGSQLRYNYTNGKLWGCDSGTWTAITGGGGGINPPAGAITGTAGAPTLRDFLNVLDYGAVCDGATDDSTAILNAITAAQTLGGTVLFPKGKTCLANSQIAIPNNAASPPLQNNLTLDCSGGGGGAWYGTDACVLDLRYQGAAPNGKIETHGQGLLKIQNLTIKDGGATSGISYSVTGGGLTNIVVTSNVAVATFAVAPPGGYITSFWVVSGSTTPALNRVYKITAIAGSTITFKTIGIADGTYNNAALTMSYSSPFIHTTSTTLEVLDNTFVGNGIYIFGGPYTPTGQDAIWLGGNTNAIDGSLNAAFQGYHTVIQGNSFRQLNNGVALKNYGNAVTVSSNSSVGTAGMSAYACDGSQANQPNSSNNFTNNIIEMQQYLYGFYLDRCITSNFIGNSFYDEAAQVISHYVNDSTGGEAQYNTFIDGQKNITKADFSGDIFAGIDATIVGAQPRTSTSSCANAATCPTGPVSNEFAGQVLVKGVYDVTKNMPGGVMVEDIRHDSSYMLMAYDATNTRGIIDAWLWNGGVSRPISLNPSGGNIGINSNAGGAIDLGIFRNAAGVMEVNNGTKGNFASSIKVGAYLTGTNCAVNSVSPAACGAASSGAVVVPTTTATYTINTTAVTATSRIFLQPTTDASNLPSAPTCVTPLLTSLILQSARVAGTSFTFTLPSTTGTTCFNYWIVN